MARGRTATRSDRVVLETIIKMRGEGKSAAEIADALDYSESSLKQKYSTIRGLVRRASTIVKVGNKEIPLMEHFANVKAKSPDKLLEVFGTDRLEKVNLRKAKLTVVHEGDLSKLPSLSDNTPATQENKAESLMALVGGLS